MKSKSSWTHKGFRIRPRIRGGKTRYVVDSSTKLGRRHFFTFSTKGEALIKCEQLSLTLKNEGVRAFDLTAGDREDAAHALEIVQRLGFGSLVDAANKLAQYHAPPSGDISVTMLRDLFIGHYKTQLDDSVCSLRHFNDLSSRTRPLIHKFGEETIKSLSPQKVWEWLTKLKQERDWSRQTLQNYTRVLTRFFNFALDKGFIAENPLTSKTIAFDKNAALKRPARKAPSIISINDAHSLLYTAHATNEERGLLPFVVLTMFAGLRPDSEADRMEWDSIDLEEGLVFVRSDKSKNVKSARTIELCPAAIEWLLLCDQAKPIVPSKRASLWKHLREEAGILKWKPDTLRHSFCTYLYGITRNKAKLIASMGHVDDEVLGFYLQINPSAAKAAKLYFDLSPQSVLAGADSKILKM